MDLLVCVHLGIGGTQPNSSLAPIPYPQLKFTGSFSVKKCDSSNHNSEPFLRISRNISVSLDFRSQVLSLVSLKCKMQDVRYKRVSHFTFPPSQHNLCHHATDDFTDRNW